MKYLASSGNESKYDSVDELMQSLFQSNSDGDNLDYSYHSRLLKEAQSRINKLEAQNQAIQNSKVWRFRNKMISIKNFFSKTKI